MSLAARNLIKLLSVGLLIVSFGCQDPNANMNDMGQNTPNAAERIQELENLLAQAESDRAVAQEQALALRTELDDLKGQLSNRSEAGPAPGWGSIPGGAMTAIEGTALFDSGKAKLKSSAKKTLAEVARVIQEKFPNHDIYVFGHTDDKPIRVSGWKDNAELSCQRALSVTRLLKSQGVSQNMCACGWGEQRPMSGNTGAKARQANRRVEIYAVTR